nr:hypothetical protein [Tanacetum cinerariifolium]
MLHLMRACPSLSHLLLVEDDRIDEPIIEDLNGSPSLQVSVSDEGYPKSLKKLEPKTKLNKNHYDFEDSSFHSNFRRRIMTLEEEEFYPWEQLKSSNVDICKEFLKLCIIDDPIWDKISCKLEEPLRNTHVDDCVCCQVQHMMEENVHALCLKMQDIHASINNDLKLLTAVIEDIAKVFLQDQK